MFRYNKLFEQLAKLKKSKLWLSLREETGSILIFTAVAIPILLGLTGIAYDVGNLYMHKARLQNVADAAALAGARAFADSQANANENDRDKIDGKVSISSYKPSVTYSLNDSNDARNKNHGTGESPHPNADREADKYIYHNLVNLGNKVSTDLYSHFAVLSQGANPKTFYRVGLAEEVNLSFLPIIRGIGKTQTVGVESIVMLYEDKGDELPATIFDNLFTFSGKLSVKENNVSNNNPVKLTFDGQILYTGNENENEQNNYFEIINNKTSSPITDQNLYTDTNKSEVNNPANYKSKYGTNKDIDLTTYVNTLINNKLIPAQEAGSCVELDMSNNEDRKLLTVDNINSKKLYEKHEKDKYGNFMYFIKYTDSFGEGKYLYYSFNEGETDDDKKYYSFDKKKDSDENDDNRILYCYMIKNKETLEKQELSDHTYRRIPAHEKDCEAFEVKDPDNGVMRTYEGYYVSDSKTEKIYYSLDIANNRVYFVNSAKEPLRDASSKANTKPTYFTLTGTHFKYTDNEQNFRLINFIARTETEFDNLNARVLTMNTNVFHLKNEKGDEFNTATQLNLNKKITGFGNTNEPIYIFDDTNCQMNIDVSNDNERPVVIIHSGSTPVNVYPIRAGCTFTGTIIAPDALAMIEPWSGSKNGVVGSYFKGNIMADSIIITKDVATNKDASHFISENHLENDTDLYSALLNTASGNGELFSNPTDTTNPPTNTWSSSWQNWYSLVGSDTAAAWFRNLNRNQQIAFWRSWDYGNRPNKLDELVDESGNPLFPDEGPWKVWYDQDGWKAPHDETRVYVDWPFKDSDWKENKPPTVDEKGDAKNGVPIEHVFDTKVRLINPRLESHPFKRL